MLNLIIFGAPGSGKGTQSIRLVERYGLHHISTGDLLRDHIRRGTELGKVADAIISGGNLIPDELMLDILSRELDAHPEVKGVIFDGFPRTISQAQSLNDMLEKRGTKVHAVVGLEVDEDDLIKRMLQRGKESGRADDNIDTIRERLNVYHNQTSPLRDFYINDGKYHAIDGNGNVDTVFSSIKKSLDKL